MFRVKYVRTTAIKPLMAVEVIVALTVLLGGVWLCSPYFHTSASVSSQILDGELIIPRILGLYQACVSCLLLYALARPMMKKREVIRRGAAFAIFTLYTFYGASGVILFGLSRVNWLSTFALAIIAGVIYLRLKAEANGNARD